MPFVKRVVCPTLLCRASDTARTQANNAPGQLLKDDSELVAVNNCALSNAIRQLASLAGHADEIFGQLKVELGQINARASSVRERLEALGERAENLNARTVTVPEGDLTTYWQRKAQFYKAEQPVIKGLFTPESRPVELQRLYDAAGQTPILKMRQMDRLRRDGKRASKIFMCTPVLGGEENRKARKRAAVSDIESSKPAALSRIREWRSSEVLGNAVAPPDVSLAPLVDTSTLLEHLLPSPEEQLSVIARHFPPEVVAVDVTGRNFDRQQRSRRSLSQIDTRRAERHRKRRSQRRNTIAGTSEAELLRQAADGASQLGGSESIEVDSSLQSLPGSKRKLSTDKVSERVLLHLNSLREWGRQRLSRAREQQQQQPTDLYETLTHIRRPRSTSPHVRMRKHVGRKNKHDVHSSSGNWSASSSSARASVESSSENRTTSHLPTSSSSSTCDSALSVRRTKVALSISSSCNSRESPDLHVSDSTGFNDGETSSVYSCDTEGYYTSFHVDSGLKTLREEPFESTNSSGNITVCAAAITTKALSCENEYELFGKGSTSTTASSAGTICTVKAPPSPPLRKSSLENLDVSSDTEAVARRARIRTALDTNRVPSMCVITPPQSEDEQPSPVGSPPPEPQKRASPQLKSALLPFNNIVGRMRDALRKSPQKETPPPTPVESPVDEYVTIASLDSVRVSNMEYVSLNELPHVDSGSESSTKSPVNSLERRRRNAGARVLLDSDGKVVYSSDSLKRKPKNATFEPGPCVKRDTVDSPQSPPTRAQQRVIIKAKDVPTTSGATGASAGFKGGAHVDMLKIIEQEQGGEEVAAAHARSDNIDPQGWARIRRNESYRLAASQHNNPQQPPPVAVEDVKRVVNPNTAGRRFYGAKIMVDPGRMGRPLHGPLYETHGAPLGRVTLPSDTQRARVLSSGLSNGTNGYHHYGGHNGVYTNTYGGTQQMNAPFWTMPRSTFDRHQQQQGASSLNSTPTKQNFRVPDCNLSPISTPSSPLASPGTRRPLFSQPRSTMSTEELYAAIHKSKKKMNIKDDNYSPVPSSCSSPVDCDRASPAGPPGTPGSRHSWSPSSAEALNGVSVSARNSFKRLLLEKGCQKGKERRMSAVEQLMATKGQFAAAPSRPPPQQTLHHSLSRRRYRHTDVLSTTIAEESEPQGTGYKHHVTASYLQHRIDQMCLSPRMSASRTPIIITKPPSPSKMSLETSL